ncbi:MAG: cytochrome bd oxidase small subunit, CydX/CbdX family [Gammaproteobacteria bacterium]|nr:cytochrome bd oxidase small subunit, CydX/CbdX family [Gammaproteobacteria bacterium]
MWYFVWIIAVLLSLGVGLIAVMWVDVRSKPAAHIAVSREADATEMTS